MVWGERWDLNLSPTKSTAISPVECAALTGPHSLKRAKSRGYGTRFCAQVAPKSIVLVTPETAKFAMRRP